MCCHVVTQPEKQSECKWLQKCPQLFLILPLCVSNREDVERRFEGKLSKHMSGSLYEMVSRVMKALVNRKITVPGNFQGYVAKLAIKCLFQIFLQAVFKWLSFFQSLWCSVHHLFLQGFFRPSIPPREGLHLCPQASCTPALRGDLLCQLRPRHHHHSVL